MEDNVVKAYFFYLRNEAGLISDYGVSLYVDDNEWYALASVHIPEPVGVLEAVRQSLSTVANIAGKARVFAYGSESAFYYRKLRQRVSGHIVSGTTFDFVHRSKDAATRSARTLALDASIRGNSIIEKL